MNSIIGGWFSEVNDLWPGQAFSLKVDKVLFDEKSAFQHILVFEKSVFPFFSSICLFSFPLWQPD